MSEDTVFMKILKGEIPSQEVYSDELFYAFRDVHPAAPTHVLVIPRKPIASIEDASEEDVELLGKMLLTGRRIARQEGLDEKGYRLVINYGNWGGQTVYHIHLHILGGRPMAWPPG